ncbi:MAG: hypothetical protein ACTSR2_10035 [Candidatus Hodarchaeales archaeon]
MKFVYVALTNSNFNGVTKKIIAQFKYLKAIEPESRLFLVLNEKPTQDLIGICNRLDNVEILVGLREKNGFFYSRRRAKFSLIGKKLSNLEPYSIVYFRYPLADMEFLRLVKHLRYKNGCFVITEHQSHELIELLAQKKLPQFLSELFFGRFVLKHLSGIVAVTEEICKYKLRRSNRKNLAHLVNGNGIDVSSVPLRNAPSFDGKTLDLLCVAHVAKWHGLDRLSNFILLEMDLRFQI